MFVFYFVFYQVRRSFIFSEIAAYIGGILLSIGFVIVWPALMLLAGVFCLSVFTSWVTMVFVWGIITAIYLGIVPLLLEVLQVSFMK
jgi:hypothetical protein